MKSIVIMMGLIKRKNRLQNAENSSILEACAILVQVAASISSFSIKAYKAKFTFQTKFIEYLGKKTLFLG